MNNSDQLYIDHEVRIRMNEETLKDMKELRKEVNSNFRWTIAIILGSVLLPVVLHWAKLL
jgi:hypothetical protein